MPVKEGKKRRRRRRRRRRRSRTVLGSSIYIDC
jgi:hypothetical protein